MRNELDREGIAPRPRKEYFVEVIAPDGLKHHVGPFKRLALAKAWIAQNERREPPGRYEARP